MKYNKLGISDINISSICLGSMTWGEQNNQAQAFEQMDYAYAQGINFFDTAELYAVSPKAETYGKTESMIGTWLKQTGHRHNITLASKVCGPTTWCPHIREGKSRLDRKDIIAACEASLERLQTDYLDIYQTHWPDRTTNYFGKLGYQHQDDESGDTIEETLSAMQGLVDAGKVRHIGISNETPWGAMQHLHLSNTKADRATASYIDIANKYGLAASQMALAFIRQQPFVSSTIIGATNMQQLASNITSQNITLSEACQLEIEAVHRSQPNPCP